MIRRTYVPILKEHMRGGDGTVTVNQWMDDGEKCPNLRMAANLVIPAGASIGAHEHKGETEIFHVMSGRASYEDNGKTVEAGPGDVMICKNGEIHGIRNIGGEDLVVNAIIITE